MEKDFATWKNGEEKKKQRTKNTIKHTMYAWCILLQVLEINEQGKKRLKNNGGKLPRHIQTVSNI